MSSRDEADKLSVVMELLKEIDNFPDHPQSFYHRLIDVAVRVIDEAEPGIVSPDGWAAFRRRRRT